MYFLLLQKKLLSNSETKGTLLLFLVWYTATLSGVVTTRKWCFPLWNTQRGQRWSVPSTTLFHWQMVEDGEVRELKAMNHW